MNEKLKPFRVQWNGRGSKFQSPERGYRDERSLAPVFNVELEQPMNAVLGDTGRLALSLIRFTVKDETVRVALTGPSPPEAQQIQIEIESASLSLWARREAG